MEVLEITNAMRDSSKKEVDELVARNNENILRAVKQGMTHAIFYPDYDIGNPHYATVKRMFEEKGYRIVPVGYCGGVWQRDEYITW